MPLQFPSSPVLNQLITTGGRSWIYNGSAWAPVTAAGTGGAQGATGATGAPGPAGTGGSGSGANVTVSNTAPISASIGNMWLDTESGDLSIFYSNNWVEVNSAAGVLISNVAPLANEPGRLWYDTDTGDISVNVGNAWVEISPDQNFKPFFGLNYINI